MSETGWNPVHYEDLVEPDEAPAKPNGAAKKTDTQASTAVPMGLALTLPTEFVNAVWGMADRMTQTVIAVDENTKAVLKLLAMVEENHGEVVDAMTESLADNRGDLTQAIKELAEQSTAMREGLMVNTQAVGLIVAALADQRQMTTQGFSHLEAAMTAPRKVTLRRDKDGRAVSATSKIEVG